jgi:hypothetical protein
MDEAHGMALEARGLSVATAVKLGWHPCAGPGEGLWLAIPIIDRGVRVGTKRRTIGGAKAFTQDKGTPQILYNVDCLRDPALAGHPLMITEGELDTLAAIQCGYPKTVSVPGGASGAVPYWRRAVFSSSMPKRNCNAKSYCPGCGQRQERQGAPGRAGAPPGAVALPGAAIPYRQGSD